MPTRNRSSTGSTRRRSVLKVTHSEGQSNMSHEHSRLQEVRTAERRKEVVQSHLVGQVVDRQRRGDSPGSFLVGEIVRANPKVENTARRHAGGIVVIIFLAREVPVPALRQRK